MSGRALPVGMTALILALSACAGGGLPDTHYYSLRPAAEGAAEHSASRDGLAVGVGTIRVDPPYDQDRLVYRRAGQGAEVGFYAYHRWAASLGSMIAVALVEELAGTPGVASIEAARSRGEYGALLRGRLLRLEEISGAQRQEVHVALELELLGDDDSVLWSSTLSSMRSGTAAEVPEVVELARQAFDEILAQARAGVAEALDRG